MIYFLHIWTFAKFTLKFNPNLLTVPLLIEFEAPVLSEPNNKIEIRWIHQNDNNNNNNDEDEDEDDNDNDDNDDSDNRNDNKNIAEISLKKPILIPKSSFQTDPNSIPVNKTL